MGMKVDAEKIIFNKLYGQEHIINEKCAYSYYNDFWKSVRVLNQSEFFSSKRIINEFCNKLKIGGKCVISEYLQGISEIMLWIYCCKQTYKFEIDVNVSGINNTDVDIQIKLENYIVNLEIKCPVITSKTPQNTLNINTGFRTIDKQQLMSELTKVEDEVINKIIENSSGLYQDFQYSKINDTKILSYLASCKDKFSLKEKRVINVLLIALPSSEIQNYWGYLYNPYSGIFTNNFTDKYICEKEKRYYTIDDLEMTDVVILSNLVSGHLKPNDAFDSWNLNNYFNLLCMNIHSKKFRENKDDEGFRILYELLPNDNKRFEEQWAEVAEYEKKNNIPLDAIFVNSFLHDNYKLLY